MNEHLGNEKEVGVFVNEMKRQLKIHEKDKTSLKFWSFENVMLNNCPELVKRVNMIIDANVSIKNDLMLEKTKENLELIAKQSVHIANYCMMCYLKALEELHNLSNVRENNG